MPGPVLLFSAAFVCVVDWWAVHTRRRRVESVAKPLAMSLLVGVAATWGGIDGSARTWLVAGAAAGVVGDVALLRDGDSRFLVGLSSFGVGHVAYVVAAVLVGFDPVAALPGLVAAVGLVSFRFVPHMVRGAAAVGGTTLAVAVVAYGAVIGAMCSAAWATGSLVAGFGAVSFACSDWIIGHERFLGPIPGGRVAVMITYHVGQALLLIGLAA